MPWLVAAAASTMAMPARARADWLGDGLGSITATLENSIASGNYGLAVLMIFAGGVLTSLTPCVYPMIAITVSVFGARQAKSWMHGAGLSLAFVLGMASLMTLLGVVVGAVGGIFGDWLNSPWVVATVAVVFGALALAMFGLFELNLPPAAQNHLAKVGGVGPVGAFLLGLVTSLLAAPCVGPPLLALLGYIGASGDIGFGALAMFSYALGLGLLFFVVGTFSVALPKSGHWLEWTKSLFGTLMLVMAIYYVGNFFPFRPTVRTGPWLMAGLALAVLGVIAGAIHLSFHGPWRERLRKGAGVTGLVAGLTAMLWWAQAAPAITPLVSADGAVTWLDDFDAAAAIADTEGRPLLIDFTASWCGACGELDRHTFHHSDVVSAMNRLGVVPVKVDLSPGKVTAQRRALLKRFQPSGGLPLVVLHDARGHEVGRITRFVEPAEFLALLDQAAHTARRNDGR